MNQNVSISSNDRHNNVEESSYSFASACDSDNVIFTRSSKEKGHIGLKILGK